MYSFTYAIQYFPFDPCRFTLVVANVIITMNSVKAKCTRNKFFTYISAYIVDRHKSYEGE